MGSHCHIWFMFRNNFNGYNIILLKFHLGLICTLFFSHKLVFVSRKWKVFLCIGTLFLLQWVHQKSWNHGCDYNLKCQVYTNVRSCSGSRQPLPPFPLYSDSAHTTTLLFTIGQIRCSTSKVFLIFFVLLFEIELCNLVL